MSNFDGNDNPYRTTHDPGQVPPIGGDPKYMERPAVLTWQMLYCVAMTLLYLGCFLIGVVFFLNAEALADQEMSAEDFKIFGVVFAVIGLPLAMMFAAGLVWRKGQGAWVFHIVLIAIGLTSACCLPTNIPLLIFWIKAKDYVVASGKK